MTATIINMKAQQGFIDRHSDGLEKIASASGALAIGGGITYGLWWGGSVLLAMTGAWHIIGGVLIVLAAVQALGTFFRVLALLFA